MSEANSSTGRKKKLRKNILRRNSLEDCERLDRRSIIRNPTSPIVDAGEGQTLFWDSIGAVAQGESSWQSLFTKKKKPKDLDEEKRLLRDCSGEVGPGEMALVIGPSGSGKSLLLSALAGRKVTGITFEGQVRINGKALTTFHMKRLAYMPASTAAQLDDLMTVDESLKFAAMLGMPAKYSDMERHDRVRVVITKLGLTEARETRIGDISQGERKRVCIAQHLLRDPKILILDEPTSNLDATSAKTLMMQLNQLAINDGLTLVVCLHQPRAMTYDLFASVVLLASGHQIYSGPVGMAAGQFRVLGYAFPEDVNPAEFMVDLASRAEPAEATRLAEGHGVSRSSSVVSRNIPDSNTGRSEKEFPYSAGWWTEYRLLLFRECLHFRRSGQTWPGLILANLLLALFVAFIWFQIPDTGYQAVQNRIGLIQFFPRDRAITIWMLIVVAGARDRVKVEMGMWLYRTSSYYAALMTFYCGTELLLETFYALIIYYIAGLRYTPFTAMLTLMGVHILLLASLYSIGIIIPYVTHKPSTAFIVGMTIWYILALYNGLYVNLAEVSWILRWPCYLSPEFYYLLAGLQNEFNGQTLDGQPGEYWLGLYALDTVSVVWCVGALLIINLAAAISSYCVLRWRTQPHFSRQADIVSELIPL